MIITALQDFNNFFPNEVFGKDSGVWVNGLETWISISIKNEANLEETKKTRYKGECLLAVDYSE